MDSGIYLIHKSPGVTSFDRVRDFKRRAKEAGQPKLALGHGGTLDPFAEGLLLILAGQATRLMELMHPLPKTYLAQIEWGRETDTGDHLGRVIMDGDASQLDANALESVLPSFLGWKEQIPPTTSAKKIEGEAAYRKAHRGEILEMRPCQVYLHEARWISHQLPQRSLLLLTCRGGFYVRSLARDLGRALGAGAHLSGLIRTSIGPWMDPGEGHERFLKGEDLIPWCPIRRLQEEEALALSHGRDIPLGELLSPSWLLPDGFPSPEPPMRALFQGRLLALLKREGDRLRTFANLRGGL